MNVREFLHELAIHFPLKTNTEKTLGKYADLILKLIYSKPEHEFDFEKTLDYLLLNSTFRTFPVLPDIINALELNSRMKGKTSSEYDGYQIRVYFKSGRFTDFTICGFGLSFSQIKEKCQNSDNVVRAVMYPPDVTLMASGKIVPEDVKGNIVYIAP